MCNSQQRCHRLKFNNKGGVRPKCEPPALMPDINNAHRESQMLFGSTAVD